MKIAANNLQAIEAYFQKQLKDLYPTEEIRKLLRMLLEHHFEITAKTLALEPDLRFSESQMLVLIRSCKALMKGKPIQQIMGHAIFYDLKLQLNEHVLIPRPETEELVDWILKSEPNDQLDVFDVGSGSGCIPLALKKNRQRWNIKSIDISKEALKIAKLNSDALDLDVEFMESDIFNPALNLEKKIDILVSNPPYVTQKEASQMHQNVLDHEPHVALFVPDKDALIFYRRILEFARRNLKQGGRVYFEINEQFGKECAALLEANHFDSIKLRKDLNGKDRMIRAIYSNAD